MVSVPLGTPNPWSLVSQATLLLLLVFFVDATITVWRRGDRQRALLIGGSIIFFGAIVAAQVTLVVWGIINVPFLGCFAYLGIVAALGYQLCDDTVRAAHLARELQASQAALHKTEQDMEIAANAADLALWTWDIARDEIWLSHKVRSLFGFSPSEKVDTERIRSVIHPEDREVLRKAVKNSLQTGGENPVEYRVLLPNGEIRWLVRRSRTEFDGKGKPVLMHGVLFDVTERRFAEERFRLVVDAAPTAMIMANKEGRITLVNRRVETLFGYARDELIGQPIEMLVPERFRSRHAHDRHGYFCDAQARPMGAGRDLFGRRKDGSEVPVEIGLNPVHTSEGPSVLASIVDISERKRAEIEAARHREELGHLNRVAMMAEMAASFGHELNQPLTGILSNASAGARFIDRGDVNLGDLRELLADIAADGRRAGDVIRAIRSMVKKGETARERMDVNELVTNVVRLVTPDALLRECEVKTSLEPNLPTIEGDPIQFEQVLLNLVVNAFEAMRDTPPSSRKVLIATEWDGNSAIRTSVRDFGIGIPEEACGRLFEQFFTTKADGLGMGLAIARRIVESNAGTIGAENVEGGGARFYFTFPANVRSSK